MGRETNKPNEDKKELKHVVIAPFRDANDFNKQYSVGEDVSHLTKPRLADLVGKGLVEIQGTISND